MNTILTSTMAWLAVAAGAFLMALATPYEPWVMGRLPSDVGRVLNHQTVVARASQAPLLALVTFHRDHRADVETWVDGLRLHQDRSIAWVRMPVVEDTGDSIARAGVEQRLLARYGTAHQREHLMPVFTNRQAFMQSTGIGDTERAYLLIVTREGEVLARIAGAYDEAKARTVRETLALTSL